MILTLSTTYITYTTIPIYAAMKAIEPATFEAATDLGAGWWQQARKILIPLAAPGIFVAMILVYIPMLTDFVTSDIVGGTGSYMMGQRVRDLILGQGLGRRLRAELPAARDVGAAGARRLPARPTEQDRGMSAIDDAWRRPRRGDPRRAVTKRFGDVVAVNDVSITIPGGEFFSMLGPSGCGKTTTLRMIAGFEAPDAGRIVLQGADVTHVPPPKRNVNMVFQAYGLFPHMTVGENIAFGPKIKKWSREETRERVAEAIRTVRLDGFEDRRPGQLSGGQQQRVALARALVNRPAALLLDEPLGALDLKLRKEMQLELKDLQQRTGTTFVYVTHDQEEAMTMSDRIAVMNGGVVEQLATPGLCRGRRARSSRGSSARRT